MGPPNSGTTSTLLAVHSAYEELQPTAIWWHWDLNRFSSENPDALFETLVYEAHQIFPGQASNWKEVLNTDEFLRALLDTLQEIRRILIISIDHIESSSFSTASSIIRLVRMLYTQRSESFEPGQLIAVVMAGSRRLMRQGVGKGSPLNFAEKHYVRDLDVDATAQWLLDLDRRWGWSFSPKAAIFIATITGGDKYLLQRISYNCIEQVSLIGDTSIDLDSARRVVDSFVEGGFLEDANLLSLLPDLVQDIDTMELVLDILENETTTIPALQFKWVQPPTSLTQLFSNNHDSLTIRNQIYYRILSRHKPIIQAAYSALSQLNNRLARLQEIQNIVSTFEYNPSRQAMQRIMEKIKNLTLASSVNLLVYDKESKQMQVLGSSQKETVSRLIPWELTRHFISALATDLGRLPCPTAEQCQTNKCLGGFDGNCSWMPLIAPGSSDFVGALAISGQSLVMSPTSESELKEVGNILAGAVLRQNQFAGIRLLSGLSLNLPENKFQQEICRIAAILFNKPYSFFWSGIKPQYRLSLRTAFGLEQDELTKLTFDMTERMAFALNDGDSYIEILDTEDSGKDPLPDVIRSIGVRTLILICFALPNNQIAILGVGSSNRWAPSDDESTLARLLAKQVGIILANLSAFQQIEHRLEISRISIPLLSHELNRGPAAIAEEAELLSNERIGSLEPFQLKAIKKIRKYALHHHELIQKLIDFTRLDSGIYKINLQIGSLGPVLINILSEIKSIMESQGNRMEVVIPVNLPSHCVDQFLMERILTNLVQNALDHTPPGSPIRIYAWADNKDTFVVVEDDGPGIPIEVREHIFEAWARAPLTDQASGPLGSLGLGLFLVKSMVEIMGGHVVYDAQYTTGARFIIRFPIIEAEQNETT